MRKLFLALVFSILVPACAPTARADDGAMVARDGKDWIRLEQGACKNGVILARAPGIQLRAGKGYVAGVEYDLCWAPVPGGYAWLFADGDSGAYPAHVFKSESDA